MSQDHYAILGVTPTVQPAVIRAAYLALMREYHPDRNASPVAAARAQAIVAAYKVLGDFDRRQQYDWDRRRAREAAGAIAAGPKRGLSAAVVIAAALGLSIAAAMMLMPGSSPVPPPDRMPDAETEVVRVAERRVAPTPPPVVEVAERAPVVLPAPKVPKMAPVEMVPELYPPPEPVAVKRVAAKAVESKKVARAPVVKAAAVEHRPRAALVVVKTPVPRAMPTPAAPIDLASLDQFVMSFYGQSWRFGDARKRKALEQSRSLFVVRRAACAADSCKRSEVLRLQRDVSAIVESGQPR